VASIGEAIVTIHPSIPVVNKKLFFGIELIGFNPDSYECDFGDGYKASGQSVYHTYTQSGKYYGKVYLYSRIKKVLSLILL
jgi:hypothetical protein